MIISAVYYCASAVFLGSAIFSTGPSLRIAYGLVAIGLFIVAVCQR